MEGLIIGGVENLDRREGRGLVSSVNVWRCTWCGCGILDHFMVRKGAYKYEITSFVQYLGR